MGLFEQYSTCEKTEKEGILCAFSEDARIRVARAGGSNVKFKRGLDQFQRKNKRELQLNLVDEDTPHLMKQLFRLWANTVVLGWEKGPVNDPIPNVICFHGDEDLEFNYDNVIHVFSTLKEVWLVCRDESLDWSNFKQNLMEDAAGNL